MKVKLVAVTLILSGLFLSLRSDAQLKGVDGYFRSSQNKDMVVSFTAKDTLVLAKLLWNGNEVHLVPVSGLSFVSKESGDEGPINVLFHRDSVSGVIDRADVKGNGSWVRANDYRPVEKKVMEHTAEQLTPFEGLYQLDREEGRYIQLFVKGNDLILKQHWDGRELPFVPESALDFYCRDMPAFTLNFTRDQQGTVTQVVAFGRDRWVRTKPPVFGVGQLKQYEGKFQSADDPDNEIRLVATDQGLTVVQLWDKKEIPVRALTDGYFNNADLSFAVQVDKDGTGKIKQVVLLGMQVFRPATK
ncbi:hypothetical protein ACQ86N_29790 [Puia sp. P3]|uniref:hypothetical protein n=1 Tax=Puia sp. P3 TaxID=3423952 RepID=UPI003D66933E